MACVDYSKNNNLTSRISLTKEEDSVNYPS